MVSKNKSKHRFGNWLLKQEDKAGIFSYRRETAGVLAETYFYKKLKYYLLGMLIISMLLIILVDNNILIIALEHKIVFLIIISIDFIITLLLAYLIKIKYSDEMKEYIRTEYDKIYGEGKYEETIRKM